MSDEHVSYLEWHDEMVPKMGGNEWAAWAKPAAARKQLISTILKVKVPLIFTFRAREKTKQEGKKVINIGWQPVAPLEIVHTLDLTCILPPRADGVPVWHSNKIGEDFIIKLPNYLAPYIQQGQPLNEQMGAAFARWAAGEVSSGNPAPTTSAAPESHMPPVAGAADEPIPDAADYTAQWAQIIQGATNAEQLGATWNRQKDLRDQIAWTDEHTFTALKTKVARAVEFLKQPA
jgi:hypothetical protein